MNSNQLIQTCDSFSIAAIHTESNHRSIILWLHGITVNKDEYLNFFRDGADYLSERGLDSLRIDFRGHGESSGTSLDFSIIGQMFDVDAALNYIVQHYSQENIPLYVIGCSFGAPPAIYAALNNPQLIKGIVLISPVLSYKRTFLNPETEWAQSIFNSRTLSELQNTSKLYLDNDFPISNRLVEEMKLIRPENDITEIKQNIVIIHGDADSMVPYNVSKDIATLSNNIKFFSIPGMDHGFMDENDEEGTGKKSLENKNQIYEIILEHCS